MIAIVPATHAHADRIAERLRPGDRREVEALGVPAAIALKRSLDNSTRAWTALDDGEPVFIWGFTALSLIGHTASLWALSSEGVSKHRRLLMEHSREFVEAMQLRFPRLEALVALDYPQACRWLKWLGFQPGDICTIGGTAFMRVWRLRADLVLAEMPAANEWVH